MLAHVPRVRELTGVKVKDEPEEMTPGLGGV